MWKHRMPENMGENTPTMARRVGRMDAANGRYGAPLGRFMKSSAPCKM